MTDDLPVCPGCNARLFYGSLLSMLADWPEALARDGIRQVAMGGGWERLELENTVPLDSPKGALCEAVWVGGVIAPGLRCPRCDAPVYDVISASLNSNRRDRP
jgi:hypothetical protein